jgi:hypothetical protein
MSTYCREVHERIEEKVERRAEQWVEGSVRKCKERDCNWWCGCCNKWFCWLEVVFKKIVTVVFVTVVKWVVRVICEAVDGVLSFIGLWLGFLFSIPLIGRFLRELLHIIEELFWRLVGWWGTLADLLGLEWQKRLRIAIIILSDANGPLTTPETLQPTIDEARRIYDAANVTLIVEGVHVTTPAPGYALDVGCDGDAFTEDLWLTGGWFERTANTYANDGNGRNLIGWASPVVVFIVKDVDGKRGCSMGPFSNYVVIEAKDPVCLAHELGHACSLWHVDGRTNLMYSSCGGTRWRKWQRILMRGSRHVTYI